MKTLRKLEKNEDFAYSITVSSYDNSSPGVTAVAMYENGDIRNLTLADDFRFKENSCLWENWE